MVDIYGIHVAEYTSHMDVMGLSFAEFQYMVSGPNWIDHLPVRVGVNIKTYWTIPSSYPLDAERAAYLDGHGS